MSIFPNCHVEIMVGKDFGLEDSLLRIHFPKTNNWIVFDIKEEVAQLIIKNIIEETTNENSI
jgi:hypothetical protein